MISSRFIVWIGLCLCASLGLAQQADTVEGYRGRIEVRQTSPEITEIWLDRGADAGAGAPSKLRYVLQHVVWSSSDDSWEGAGRVYVTRSVVALVGFDGTQRMYKLPEAGIPKTLLRFNFKPLPVYGISVYSEVPQGLQENAVRSSNRASQGLERLPLNAPACPDECQAGGPGAQACTIGYGGYTCSVSGCSGDFHACCWMNGAAPQCRCCM